MAAAAKVCGVDPSTVYRWERRSRRQLHTHRGNDGRIEEGRAIMRWAAEQRARGRALTVDELVLEAARRRALATVPFAAEDRAARRSA
jgi:hypothetical protein